MCHARKARNLEEGTQLMEVIFEYAQAVAVDLGQFTVAASYPHSPSRDCASSGALNAAPSRVTVTGVANRCKAFFTGGKMCGPKKKLVPSDPKLSLNPDASMHGSEFCNRITGDNSSAPRRPFWERRINALEVARVRPGWNQHLATAFRSPVTTARFQTAVPGSKFPACRFDALLNLRQARSAYGSFALSG